MPTTLAMEKLKRDLAAMGEMCEYALTTALMALMDRDSELACHVIDYDAEIDEMELAVDRVCVELLQGGQLSGKDTLFVVATTKINNDLERVGDLASVISEHVLFLVREQSVLSQIVDFQAMLEQVGEMVRQSIEALLESDVKLAWQIIDERRKVAEETLINVYSLMELMRSEPRTIERCCHILFIVQSLHRVADQASNIAEEVIFMTEGVNIRHHIREFHPYKPRPYGELAPAAVAELEGRLVSSHRQENRGTSSISTRILAPGERKKIAINPAKIAAAREKLLKLRGKKGTK